jgi:hypothetical protein
MLSSLMPDNFICQGKCLARLWQCFMLTYLDAILPNTTYLGILIFNFDARLTRFTYRLWSACPSITY